MSKRILGVFLSLFMVTECLNLDAMAEETDSIIQEDKLTEEDETIETAEVANDVSSLTDEEPMNEILDDAYENPADEVSDDCATDMVRTEDSEGDFEYTVNDGKLTITKYTGTKTEIIIPNTIDGYTVSAIGIRAFSHNDTIRTLQFNTENFRSIEEQAFFECTALENITLPGTLEYLGDNAFAKCVHLRRVIMFRKL